MIAALSASAAGVITTITGSVSSIITRANLRINPGWENGFGKVITEKQRQTASLRIFNQGAIAVTTQLYVQERSAVAAERAILPASLTTTVTNAVLLSEQTSVVSIKTADNNSAFMTDFYSTKSNDPGVMIDRRKPYCSQADVDRGRCDKASSPTIQNADLMVNTILNPGEGQYETLADDEREAGIAFVKNVVNPVPINRLKGPQSGSAQAKAYEAALLADQSAMSLAAHSFNAIIANRTRRHQQ